MKKIFSVLIALTLTLSLFPLSAFAAADPSPIVPFGKYGFIAPFSDGLAVVSTAKGSFGYWAEGGQEGVIDKTGKEIVPLGKYDGIYPYSEGLAVVSHKNLNRTSDYKYEYGAIDKTGKQVIPFEYSSIDAFYGGVAVASKNFSRGIYEYGLIDTQGNEVTPFEYTRINAFSDGVAVAEKDGLFGVIDTKGNVIVPFGKYGWIGNTEADMRVQVYSDGMIGISDTAPLFNMLGVISDSVGVIDTTGKEIVPIGVYDWMGRFIDGAAVVAKDNKLGAIDKTGKVIVPLGKYAGIADSAAYIRQEFYDGMAVVFDSKENVGVIDATGKEIIPIGKYSWIILRNSGLMEVTGANWKGTSVINKSGSVVIPFDNITGINMFSDGMAVVVNGTNIGVIDTKGNMVIPFGKYADIDYTFSEGMALVKNKDGWVSAIQIRPDPPKPIDTASSWAKDGITKAIAKGFVPADLQDKYTNTITRAEFCRMAVKWLEYRLNKPIDTILSEKGLTRDPNAFSDTKDSDILAAYALKITSGVGNNKFNPTGQFSREQASTMIRNTCKAAGMDVSNTVAAGFADINTASSWAVDGINWVRNAGIMSGTSTDPSKPTFSPKGTYTRQESIVTFDRIK